MQKSNITVKLPLSTGEVLDVIIPTSLSNLGLSPLITFDEAYKELVALFADEEEDDVIQNSSEHALEYMLGLAKCIAAFSDHKIDEILKANYEQALTEKAFTNYPLEELDELEGITAGLTKVFNIIWSLRSSYEYNKGGNVFEYKGVLWTIPEKLIHKLTGATSYDVVSVGEVISIFRQKKALEAQSDKISPKDIAYSDRLRVLAILAESDELKYDGTDEYVNTMSKYFEDIDAQTAEDINFFLSRIWTISNPSLNIDTFLTHPMTSTVHQSRKLRRKLQTLGSGIE